MAFNWQAYLDNYPDLRHAGILTETDAIDHWNTCGMHEGRTDKPMKAMSHELYLMNWQDYIQRYPDLQAAGITSDKDALTHWIQHGNAEGRTVYPIQKNQPPKGISGPPKSSPRSNQDSPKSTITKPLNSRPLKPQDIGPSHYMQYEVPKVAEAPPKRLKQELNLIDWHDYIQKYPDLQAAGVITDEDAYNHWLQFGTQEDRIIVPKYPLVLPEVTETNERPNVIYQRWQTKKLPPNLQENLTKLIDVNYGFKHELYDDTDCRKFIMKEFPPQVLYAYDSLIPDSCKEDLWKYCILYLYGGIYQDIKLAPIDSFSFYNVISEKQYFCYDTDTNNISPTIIICLPGNVIMKNCIETIYLNVITKMYGKSELDPTGANLISKFITKQDCALNYSSNSIFYNDIELLNNASKLQGTEECAKMWKKNRIYADISLAKYLS